MISVDEFLAEAERFLEANAGRKVEEEFEWGRGSDRVVLIEDKTLDEELQELAEAREWRHKSFDAGFEFITGPVEYGGRGLTADHETAYRELESLYDVASQAPFMISLGIVGPAVLAHGTEEVRNQFVRAMQRGDVVACQLFSEPGAGSDLAGLQTKAVRDGDDWIITGQKVWTSGAQFSDVGEILTRTSTDGPKHKGITAFLIDMDAPGVEVRPLRQITGGAHFNEVFLDEVRVPDSRRLGGVGEGWSVAITTLMSERATIGGDSQNVGGKIYERLQHLVQHLGLGDDPMIRHQLADLYMHTTVAAYTNLRVAEKLRAGQMPGPEMSISKLTFTANLQRAVALASRVLGPRLATDSGEWGTYAWAEFMLGVPGVRIAGGSDEIQHNIIGERVLGLPKEPRPQQ